MVFLFLKFFNYFCFALCWHTTEGCYSRIVLSKLDIYILILLSLMEACLCSLFYHMLISVFPVEIHLSRGGASRVGILLSCLTQLIFLPVPNQYPDFQHNVWWSFSVFYDLKWDVCFVDISGFDDNHCLNCLHYTCTIVPYIYWCRLFGSYEFILILISVLVVDNVNHSIN